MATTGPPAFVSAASAVFDVSPEVLRRAKRNEAIASAVWCKDLFEAEAEERAKMSSRQQLFQLAQASIRRQHWRADLLHSQVPASAPDVSAATRPPSSPSSSDDVYRRVVLRYGQLQHKARKLRQLDASRVANLNTIATLVATILAEKSPSFSFGPVETTNSTYGSGSTATLPNLKPTASMSVADCTLGLCAPPQRLLSRPQATSRTAAATTIASASSNSHKATPTMSTQPTRRSAPRTPPPAPTGPVVPTGLSLLQQRMRQSKELDARAAQSCLEEATFWRWVESAAKEEEEEDEDGGGCEDGEGVRAAGTGQPDAQWARLHAQIGGMVPMMAQLEAAISLLFASGAVRPSDMEAIAAKTQREVRESGIAGGDEAQAAGDSRDWTRHPAYASLLALYADATPRSVSGALSALREGHASTLAQAHRACEAAHCPFDFVFDSDVVRLGKVQRGQG